MSTVDFTGVAWRKSSRSGGASNTNCVEVAFAEAVWRKSSRSSGASNANCVEVASTGRFVGVRDSKNPSAPPLAFPAARWASFLHRLGS